LVIFGSTRAFPAWAARMAATSSSGGEVERGQHHHLRLALLHQPPAGLHAVETGHPDVHEHHIGMKAVGLLDGFDPVRGLADHLEVVLGLEDQAQTPAHHRLVVGQEQADHPTSLAGHAGPGGDPSDAGGRPAPADSPQGGPPAPFV
jgi:hypothetical protein